MTDVAKAAAIIVQKHGGKNLEFSKTDKEAADLWQGRKAALWSIMGLIPESRAWTTDVW
jgi:D-lactate dehydrogenase (cytochrome)